MLLLTSITDKVRLTSTGTANLDVHASYVDYTATTQTPARTNTAISSATTTDIVGVPGSSTTRNVKFLSVRNSHASASNGVTILHTDGTTAVTLWVGTLLAGETVVFHEGTGWQYLDANGNPKLAATKLNTMLRVTNDVINATTSFADITDLTVALLSGKKYAFVAYLFHQTNATTTGAQFGVNIGAAPTVLNVSAIQQITSVVTGGAWGSGNMVAARDTAAVAETTGPGAANMLAIVAGFIIPSADGTFAMRCASEVAVAAGLTVKAGSWMHIIECAN
jgi:hypothetical protein